jgi:hypothetical protein
MFSDPPASMQVAHRTPLHRYYGLAQQRESGCQLNCRTTTLHAINILKVAQFNFICLIAELSRSLRAAE